MTVSMKVSFTKKEINDYKGKVVEGIHLGSDVGGLMEMTEANAKTDTQRGPASKSDKLKAGIERDARAMGLTFTIPANPKKEIHEHLLRRRREQTVLQRKYPNGAAYDLARKQQKEAKDQWKGRTPSSDEQVAERKETKAMHETGHMLALPPYGWTGIALASAKTEAKKLAASADAWPFSVPSFEVWCAMTTYDPSQGADGGESFQAMLHYLLVDGRHASEQVALETNYWGANPSDSFVKAAKDAYWDSSSSYYAYISKQSKVWSGGKGGKIGYNSQGSKTATAAGFTSKGVEGVEVPVSVRPGSKGNWFKALGVSMGQQNKHDVKASQFSKGVYSGAQFETEQEIKGVMALGNRAAVLIGLYYYPKCDDKALNWVYAQEVDGHTYHIKMRLPNPNYERKGGTLIAYEEANAPVISQIGGHPQVDGKDYLGGQNGFEVPHIFRPRDAPMLHVNLFAWPNDGKLVTQVAPFFGTNKPDTHYWSTKAEVDRAYVKGMQHYFKKLMHTPEDKDGFFFGFRMSKALWLYPHVYSSDEMRGTVTTAASELQEEPYQPVPQWRIEFQGGEWRKQPKMDQSPYELFAEPEFGNKLLQVSMKVKGKKIDGARDYSRDEKTKLRRYALNIDTSTTTVPTLNVEINQIPTDEPQFVVDTELDEDPQNTMEQPETLDDDGTPNEAQTMAIEQATLSFGDKSLGVAELVQNLTLAGEYEDPLSADLAAEGKKVTPIDKVITEKERLPPGSDKTERDKNEHFKTPDAQPWPHDDLYEVSRTKLVTKAMDNKAVKAYEAKYGTVSNLYMRSEDPLEITGIEVNYGLARKVDEDGLARRVGEDDDGLTEAEVRKMTVLELRAALQQRGQSTSGLKATLLERLLDTLAAPPDEDDSGVLVMDLPITSAGELYRKNLRRILCIYFHNREIGAEHTHGISFEDKQKGMLNGIFGKDIQGGQSYEYPKYSSEKGFRKPLWKAVFSAKPPSSWAKCFDFKLCQGSDKSLLRCLDNVSGIGLDEWCEKYPSTMTVREWVTTPWHYAYLPYQPQKALFKDGETYSEGCNRCSRPFFEFEEHYSYYRYSIPFTSHWPMAYWSLDVGSKVECKESKGVDKQGRAPQPFHHAGFWSKDQTKPVVGNQEVQVSTDTSAPQMKDEDGNWHNWPTYKFQMPECEWWARFATQTKLKKLYDEMIGLKIPATFRKYYNHVYNPNRSYRSFPQGKLTHTAAKVKYGQTDYKLSRSSKYGNCCIDCAAVLEAAPGLYMRNYKVVKPLKAVRGNQKGVNTNVDWWPNLLARVGVDKSLFNPAWLHINNPNFAKKDKKKIPGISKLRDADQLRYMDAWEKGMELVSKHLQERHGLPSLQTKHMPPPDIYIQKAVKDPDEKGYKGEPLMLANAIKTLKKLIQLADSKRDYPPGVPRPAAPDLTAAEFENQAFRDMVSELERKYTHKATFGRGDPSKVFDSNMVRTEYRNEEHPIGGDKYFNCLRIRQWKPKLGVHGPPSMNDYETTIYYASRFGDKGKAVSGGSAKLVKSQPVRQADRSQWAGDGFVTEWFTKLPDGEPWPANKPWRDKPDASSIQTRALRQSRLFITYSLHRAVTSESEARFVMERMANAAHLIFGDDRFLSQLLVFGMKLDGFSREKDKKPDSLSAAYFKLIDAPRKKEAEATFYATGAGSSYIYDTYETHVDKVSVDGGIEIGPLMKHPHFHILVTINHWSYVHIDYFKMNHFLELLFRGQDPYHWFAPGFVEQNFMLVGASGDYFYTDNEQPYVDIRLYPQDNWQDIITAYVRKSSTPGIMEAIRTREGPAEGPARPTYGS